MDPGAWTIERESALDGYTVEWAGPERLVLSRRNALYETPSAGAEISRLGAFPAPWLRGAAARVRPVQRLLRFSFYNVVALGDGSLFLTFAKNAGVLRGDVTTPVQGLLRPMRVLRNACALDASGDVYFGEYIPNADRGPVHLYRLPAGSTRVEVAHRFDAGEIRHVHGVYRDPHDGALWCVTGDRPSECRILRSTDGFRTMETIGSGDESWRAVSLVFTPAAVYYGTDAEFRPNHLYRIERASGTREALVGVEGPVYYSTSEGGELFFGVTAELCPSQTEAAGVIWQVGEGSAPRRLAAMSKDRLPVRFFLPGTIDFAGGPGRPGEVYLRGTALVGGDTRVHRLRPRADLGPAA
jgi:hypothetical protein